MSAGVGYTSENVWSRQARRKMKLAGSDDTAMKLPSLPDEVELGVRIQIRYTRGQKASPKEVETLISWIRGTDSVLFESFCGMIRRKMEGK